LISACGDGDGKGLTRRPFKGSLRRGNGARNSTREREFQSQPEGGGRIKEKRKRGGEGEVNVSDGYSM
jgi:hypothetical protein